MPTLRPTVSRALSSGVIVHVLTGIAFWLSVFPVLVGAMTLVLMPQTVSHYRKAVRAPGTDSYHADMRRELVSSIGNAIIRIGGVGVLIGFAVITTWPVRPLQCGVCMAAIITSAAHLMLPVVLYGPVMMVAWSNALYFMPAAVGVLSAVSLLALRLPSPLPVAARN